MLGYHGCDKDVGESILSGGDLKPSRNDYDWLGSGIYFWEANPKRGLEYAAELKTLKRGRRIETPFVIGAVIDLGLCLDLTTAAGTEHVCITHQRLLEISKQADQPLPTNSRDLLRRNLDCAVISLFRQIRESAREPSVDSVRGVFIEGEPIYPDSGFNSKTHIQVCVCNPDQIKGVFRVPERFLA